MLESRITEDYKQAMKDRNALKVSTLSFLRAQLKNVMIDKKQDTLNDVDVISVIKKQAKQREDSITQFEKGGRADLVDKEKSELEILKNYLPAEMPQDELQKFIAEAMGETQASSIKDMGKVIKVVMAKAAGRADGKAVSDLVKQTLSRL